MDRKRIELMIKNLYDFKNLLHFLYNLPNLLQDELLPQYLPKLLLWSKNSNARLIKKHLKKCFKNYTVLERNELATCKGKSISCAI